MKLPNCPRCKTQILVPLSDYGGEHGGSMHFKAWICLDQQCGWSVRIDKGQPSYSRVSRQHD